MLTESWEAITGEENLLILATCPGDEAMGCGGLIAQSCRRGRPPFVLVLTDGCEPGADDSAAALLEQRTRAAARCLGLPSNRLLMAGLPIGHVPAEGRAFESVVHGVTTVMWARDCNVICAPALTEASPDRITAAHIAAAVAARSGVGLLTYHLPPSEHQPAGRVLDITRDLPAKHLALAAHETSLADVPAHEVFVPGAAS